MTSARIQQTALPGDLDSGSQIGSEQATKVRFRVLAMLCILSMITYIDRVCFGTAAKPIADALGLSGTADLKWAFTAFAIAYAVFELPAGWMGDRMGPRGMLVRIVIWWSVCTALTGLIGLKIGGFVLGGLGTLIALRFLFGAGEAGAFPNITRAVHNWFPRTEWETAQGFIWMSGRLAGGLTPLIWMFLVSGTSATPAIVTWRGAFILFGCLGLLWCLSFYLYFRNSPAEKRGVNQAEQDIIQSDWKPAEQNHARVPWKAMLTNRNILVICGLYALMNYSAAFNFTYLPAYLNDRFQVGDHNLMAAIYKGAPLWAGAIGCLTGGFLINLISRRNPNRMSARKTLGVTALSVSALCWLMAINTGNFHVFCISVALAGFSMDLTLAACWATCQTLGGKNTAVVAALMNTIGTLGSALAGWLTGTIVQASSANAAKQLQMTVGQLNSEQLLQAQLTGYQAVFISIFLAYVVGAICWMLINPRGVAEV